MDYFHFLQKTIFNSLPRAAVLLISAFFLKTLPLHADSSGHFSNSPRALFIYLRQSVKKDNLTIQKLENYVTIAQLDLAQADDLNLPRLELFGSTSKSIPDTNRNQSIGAKLNYKIYDFGRLSARKKTLTHERDLKDLQKSITLDELFWDLETKILSIQNSHHIHQIQSSILAASEFKQKITESNVRKGLRPLYELKLAELERNSHQVTLSKVYADMERSLEEFGIFLDQFYAKEVAQAVFLSTKMRLKEAHQKFLQKGMNLEIIRDISDALPPPHYWLETVKRWNLNQDELSAKFRDLSKAKSVSETETLNAEEKPEVFLNLEAAYGGSWDEQRPSYNGQLGITWTLPWKGKGQAEREKISKKAQIMDLDYALITQRQMYDYEMGLHELMGIIKTWEAQDSLYQIKQELQHMIRERQLVGKATAFEVAQTELELSNMIIEKVKTAHKSQEIVLKIARSLKIKNPELILNNHWSSPNS